MEEKKKRKVTFHPDVQEDLSMKKSKNLPSTTTTTTTNNIDGNESRLHRGKYALDSDEEDQDDLDEQKQMNEEELNDIGQEKATIGFDDDVKITPFNIDEELEDGHYDESGCFQWKKKNKDDIRDAWLDEIDWTNVKNYKLKTNSNEEREEEKVNPNDQIDSNKFDEKSTLELMLKLMQPGETVTRTIKRLGTSISKNSKSKSKGKEKVRRLLPGEIASSTNKSNELTDEDLKKNQILFNQISGLADQFVSNGDLDIYQETYERLKSKFDRLNSLSSKINDSNFDMYGDDDINTSVQTTNSNSNSNSTTKEIRWEYLIDETNCSTIEGPLTTEEMIRLCQTEGKFDLDKVKCRRQGTEQFYSIKRIDFDLYLD